MTTQASRGNHAVPELTWVSENFISKGLTTGFTNEIKQDLLHSTLLADRFPLDMASRFVAVIFVLLVAIANFQEVNGFTAGAGNIGKRTERVQNTEVRERLFAC